MKKKLILTFIVLTSLALSLFAGGFDIALNSAYVLPIKGWNLSSGDDNNISKTFSPGFLEELELGYGFENGIKVSATLGFGFNEQTQVQSGSSFKLYNIPLTIDGTFPLVSVENFVFYTKVGAGADFRLDFNNKVIYIGPMVSLALGGDVRIVEGLYLGLVAKVNVMMNFAGDGEVNLYYSPFGLNIRYQF